MSELVSLAKLGSGAVFAALGIAGVLQWRRRRGPAGFWLALMSGFLAVVVVVASSSLYPPPSHPWHGAITRLLAATLLSVPYAQYRFMATFSPRGRRAEMTIAAATVAVVAGALVVPQFPGRGEPYTPVFAVFVAAAVVYWVTLSAHAAVRLWAEGRSQPMAARLRMRTLGAGTLGLAVAVAVSGARSPAATGLTTELVLNLLALVSGVILLTGFAPPPALRAWWRRREGTRTWQLARELMAASTEVEVAEACAGHASRMFGGRGAVLAGGDGTPVGARGLEPEEARRLAAAATAVPDQGGAPRASAQVLAVPCGPGWLVVQPGGYTPFFGDAEADELRDVAALAELALTRVALHGQVRSSHQQLNEAQSLARVGSWEWDAASDTVSWSDELFRLHGLAPASARMRYADVLATVHPDDRELFERTVRTAVENTEAFSFEHRVVHPDGTVLRLHARGKVEGGGPGQPVRLLGACRDITAQRGLEEAVAHGALHDPLTQLANRMLFTERLSRALTRVEQGDAPMALLLLDLDDFAAVNDTHGPAAGDEVLRTAAARVRGLARPVDTVARLGADQFGVLLEDADVAWTTALAERIRGELARPVPVPDGPITVHASIGIMAGTHAVSAAEFLRNADAAMRAAKQAGKDGYRVFGPGMEQALTRRLRLRADLQRAVPDGQLWLAFQPIVSLTDGAVLAVEALVRWQHPELGPVSPTEFVAIAEESGLIIPIGQWVLHEAVSQVCSWSETVPQLHRVGLHVNVSAHELHQASLVDRFAAELEASGMDPELLTVEITESVLMGDNDASVAALEKLRCLGVRVAIDDFGTGYSSLSYLRRLPVDTLKIDKEFLDGVSVGPEEAALARAVIKIGHALRLSVVAEGVETLDQANRLRSMGCAAGQGFHFCRPLPGDELLAIMAAQTRGQAVAG